MKIALVVVGGPILLGAIGMAIFVFVVQNVETPRYVPVLQDGVFEVRDYPPLTVAEVRRQGGRQDALSQGFGPLARYIFAKERGGERIAMTAPVTQSGIQGGDWAVRFIMPSEYRLEDLPPPSGSDVRLERVPARRSAAIRFSGRTDDATLAEKERELRAWMESKGLKPAAAPVFAYYNDPFTPGFLRRNEVLIDLVADSAPQTPAP